MNYDKNQPGQRDENSSGKNIQANDIKNLVQQQGRATINDKEFTLKNPSSTDERLQEIVKEPDLSVTPVGSPSANGDCEYELNSHGRSIKVTIGCQNPH